MKLITLTTDFGTRDWFVGTMKGVIAGIAPETRVIDLTHEIRPGDIAGGAFSLGASYAFFPPGTIHVVVVDPGAGSERRPITVRTSRYIFVAPDNGVLSGALRRERVLGTRVLENRALFLEHVSQTFHGRDIFSPVAAHLSNGTPFEQVGALLKTFARLDWPRPKRKRGELHGRILYIDRFGNGITNIPNSELVKRRGLLCRIQTNRLWHIPCRSFYSAVAESTPVAIPGSSGYLEIAVNTGSAEKELLLRRGCPVVLGQWAIRSRNRGSNSVSPNRVV